MMGAGPPFAMVPTRVFTDDELLETDLRVLGALCSFWNPQKGRCWPSHAELASLSGRSDRTVRRSLRRLRDRGYIAWQPVERESGMTVRNDYYVGDLPGLDGHRFADLLLMGDDVQESPPRRLILGRTPKVTTPPDTHGDPPGWTPMVTAHTTDLTNRPTQQTSTTAPSAKNAERREFEVQELDENTLKVDGRVIGLSTLADGRVKAANPADDEIVDLALAWLADKPKTATGTEG